MSILKGLIWMVHTAKDFETVSWRWTMNGDRKSYLSLGLGEGELALFLRIAMALVLFPFSFLMLSCAVSECYAKKGLLRISRFDDCSYHCALCLL